MPVESCPKALSKHTLQERLWPGTFVVEKNLVPDLELFLDSPGISRRHALIQISGDEATVEDLGSKNGTFVGSARVRTPTRLADQQVFFVGSVRLMVCAVVAQPSTRTEAPLEPGE
jgi:pSer/pThr/pTyr-binding forkhead associated (FHA) protein